jgi:hypothetical protein
VQQKTVTVIIDENGNSSVDLDGFAGQGCEKVLKDFQGKDSARLERRKAAYHAGTNVARETAEWPSIGFSLLPDAARRGAAKRIIERRQPVCCCTRSYLRAGRMVPDCAPWSISKVAH